MKKLLLSLALVASLPSFAQKVDLDRFHFDVAYQALPKENVPLEKRTFGIHIKSTDGFNKYVPDSRIYEQLNVDGWKKVESNPTVGVDFVLEDFIFKGTEVKTETVNEKDKDGNITKSTTYYWVEARYSARGYAVYKGPFTPSKEALEQAKKKEEAKATNKFLANAVVKPADNTGGENQTLALGRELFFTTNKKTVRDAAVQDFNTGKDAIYEQKLRDFVNQSITIVNQKLNTTYGFPAIQTRDILWILDAKNEEGKTQIEAIEAVKELFKGMKADEPTEQLAKNLQPLIDYFESLKTKYTSSDKSGRKMRYSAYYNLAKIYYYLDMPDKVIKEAEGLIANDYDTKDGKNLIEDATKLKDIFAQTGFISRHNPSLK